MVEFKVDDRQRFTKSTTGVRYIQSIKHRKPVGTAESGTL